MINTGLDSRAAVPVERHARQFTGMRPIFASAVIAGAVVSALAITPPVFARNGSGSGAVSTSSSTGSAKPSYSTTRAPNATGSAGHRISGTGSSPQLNNASRGESWHHGSTPPGWTEHGEKRGWDGGRTPPGLSRHDHDHDHDHDLQSHDRRSYWGDERGDRQRAQFHTGQLERRWGW
jgi:hypothetical protein